MKTFVSEENKARNAEEEGFLALAKNLDTSSISDDNVKAVVEDLKTLIIKLHNLLG